MTTAGQRGGEQGFATIVGLGIALVLAVTAIGAIGIGRMTAARADLQRATDAAALSATQLIREHGLPFNTSMRRAAEGIAEKNGAADVSFNWSVHDRGNFVEIGVTGASQVKLGSMLWGGNRTIKRHTGATLSQVPINNTERRKPKLVLSLDYSGSMNGPIAEGEETRAVDILEASVEALIDAPLEIEYAAVAFDADVLDDVSFGSGAKSQIKALLDANDSGGGTHYAPPLRRSASLLQRVEDTGYYVLMVSDGQPGDSIDEINAAAADVWGIGATIFTLEIRRQGSTDALADNLINISGSPSDRGNPDYHFVATSADEIVEQFENVMAEILCRAGPLRPVPANPADVRIFLRRQGRNEIRLREVADVFEEADTYGYIYDRRNYMLTLTDKACSAVLDRGYQLVTRSIPGELSE